MLSRERLQMSHKERDKVDALISEHATGDTSASMCREDPGETGALLVTIGDDTWRVTEARASKIKAERRPKAATSKEKK